MSPTLFLVFSNNQKPYEEILGKNFTQLNKAFNLDIRQYYTNINDKEKYNIILKIRKSIPKTDRVLLIGQYGILEINKNNMCDLMSTSRVFKKGNRYRLKQFDKPFTLKE